MKKFLDWHEKEGMKEDQGEGNKMLPRLAEKEGMKEDQHVRE